MSPEWVLLWTGAGRHSIGHFLINANNYCENYFRQSKSGPVMGGQMPSDPMEFLEKLIGLPYVAGSIEKSYFTAQCVKISDIVGDTNMRRPERARITPLRFSLNKLLAVPGSVRDVTGAKGVLYDVATTTGCEALRVGGVGAVASHRVSLLHGCPCGEPNVFCKHVLAARVTHLRSGRERCWRDAELCPHYDEFDSPPMSVEDLFASLDTATAPAPPTADGVRAAYDAQVDTLAAKLSRLEVMVGKLARADAPVLEDDAPLAAIEALASRVQRLGRLAETVSGASRAAEALVDGWSPVAAGGARRFARSARSAAEIAARATAPLQFRGALSPSADFSVRVDAGAGAGGGGAGAGAGVPRFACGRAPERGAAHPDGARAAGGGGAGRQAPPDGSAAKRARRHSASPPRGDTRGRAVARLDDAVVRTRDGVDAARDAEIARAAAAAALDAARRDTESRVASMHQLHRAAFFATAEARASFKGYKYGLVEPGKLLHRAEEACEAAIRVERLVKAELEAAMDRLDDLDD